MDNVGNPLEKAAQNSSVNNGRIQQRTKAQAQYDSRNEPFGFCTIVPVPVEDITTLMAKLLGCDATPSCRHYDFGNIGALLSCPLPEELQKRFNARLDMRYALSWEPESRYINRDGPRPECLFAQTFWLRPLNHEPIRVGLGNEVNDWLLQQDTSAYKLPKPPELIFKYVPDAD